MLEVTFLNIQGIRIRYQRSGEGDQVVLLLHGWGSSIEGFDTVSKDLSVQFTVFAIDFPGHGESDPPPVPWGTQEFADLVIAFMDEMRLTKVHILAHSFGGRVTIRLATNKPERVRKLILVSSAGVPPRRSVGYYSRVALAKIGGLSANLLGSPGTRIRDYIYTKIASPDYRNAGPLRASFVKIVNEDLRPLLPRIIAPCLLLWGENDTDTPVSSARTMARLLPNAQLRILKNAGHFCYIDQFGQFRLWMWQFLQDHI